MNTSPTGHRFYGGDTVYAAMLCRDHEDHITGGYVLKLHICRLMPLMPEHMEPMYMACEAPLYGEPNNIFMIGDAVLYATENEARQKLISDLQEEIKELEERAALLRAVVDLNMQQKNQDETS